MILTARIGPRDFLGGEAPWLVKCALEGFALGCMPAFARWRLPPLYESGVRYRADPGYGSGVEAWQMPCDVYRAGFGDCDKLTIWRLCELWAAGLPASCRTVWDQNKIHVLIRRSVDNSGPLEDPSIMLGALRTK